jgi:hypothetical protein
MRMTWLDRRVGRAAFGLILLAAGTPACLGADWFVEHTARSSEAGPALRVHAGDAQSSVSVDVAAVEPSTRELSFSLPDGRAYIAEQTHYQRYDHDWTAWSGALRLSGRDAKEKFQGHIFISRYQGMVSAVIHAFDGDYLIVPLAAGKGAAPTHQLVHVGASALCPTHLHRGDSAATSTVLPFAPGVAAAAKSHQVIDVMTLYTRHFLASAAEEQQVRAFITTAVGAANQIFVNSDVDSEYRLVHMGPLPPSDLQISREPHGSNHYASKAVGVALDWMTDEPAVLTDMRDAYGADMVSLFLPLIEDTASDICGIANLPVLNAQGQESIDRLNGPLQPFNQRAYIALENNCGQNDHTYAHEHGHNLSMMHVPSDAPPTTIPIHAFTSGYVFDGGLKRDVATVMGCNHMTGPVAPGVCNRIPYFSNPLVLYNNGAATGTAGANNALVGQLRSAAYAGFKPVASNLTPSIGISAPADGVTVAPGMPITFVASASDPENGNLSADIEWHSSVEPITGSGSPFTTSLLVGGSQVITASVVDKGGKRVEKSIRVNVQGQPEIRVMRGAVQVIDGGSFAFATTSVDQLPISQLFSICNDGTGGLLINNPGSLVSGDGFTQIDLPPASPVAPGACTQFRVRFHVGNPGNYQGQVTILNNDANENPYNIALSGVATDSAVQLIATYVPSLNAARSQTISSSDNPPSFDYYFDANLGRFEERAAAPCHQGQNNPTYLKLRLGGSILAQGGIDACTFQASWDSAPLQCTAPIIATLNSGQESIINTDDYLQDLASCEEFQPLRPHTLFNQAAWFRVDFVVDGVHYPRRLNFRKSSESLRVNAQADTYVSQLMPDSNFGAAYPLQVRSVATNPNDGKYAYVRFPVTQGFADVGSARLHWKVLSNPISNLILYNVGNGVVWNESLITWNNRGTQIGSGGTHVTTLSNLPAGRSAIFNVDSIVTTSIGTQYYTFRAETSDTRAVRQIGSREAPGAGDRPQLHITLDH